MNQLNWRELEGRGVLPHLQEYILGANSLAICHCVLRTLTRLQYIGILTLLCLLPRLERDGLRVVVLLQWRCHQVNFLFATSRAGCFLCIASSSGGGCTSRCCQTDRVCERES